MVIVLYMSHEDLADNSQDIKGCDHDGAASQDHECSLEEVGVLESSEEDGHLRKESAQARQS